MGHAGKGKEEGKNQKESKTIGRNKRTWVHGKDGRVRMGQRKKGRKCNVTREERRCEIGQGK
jgi:hypothetical protein